MRSSSRAAPASSAPTCARLCWQRGDEVVAVDNLITGSERNVDEPGRPARLQLPVRRRHRRRLDRRPGRRGHEPGQPRLARRLRGHPAPDPPGRQRRDQEPAGPGAGQGCPLLPGLHQRGLRRPDGASPVGDLLGPRQPDRAPLGLRRGQALRRGAHHGLPPHARPRRAHRAHLQHLRAPHAPRRRPGRVQLHQPGPVGQAAHGLRRRLPDPELLLRRRRGRGVPRRPRLRLRRAGQHRQPDGVHRPRAGPTGPRDHRLALGARVRRPPRGRPDPALPRHHPGPRPRMGAPRRPAPGHRADGRLVPGSTGRPAGDRRTASCR